MTPWDWDGFVQGVSAEEFEREWRNRPEHIHEAGIMSLWLNPECLSVYLPPPPQRIALRKPRGAA